MPKKNSFEDIENEILNTFNKEEIYKSYTERRLLLIFSQKRDEWNIPRYKRVDNFITYLVRNKILKKIGYKDHKNEIKNLYHIPDINKFSIYAGLKRNAYYTHYTAMYLNQLTNQIPKTHYLNFEHYTTNQKDKLTQEKIDKTFSKPQRKSNKVFTIMEDKLIMTNGKYTNKTGIIKETRDNNLFEYTDIERTLLDITIRPVYAGGVFEVLNAYKEAKTKLNVQKLKKYLDKLDYVYPYYQSIGFYLQNAGYSEKEQNIFKKNLEFDFYLTYNLKKPQYSKKWRLWYPWGM